MQEKNVSFVPQFQGYKPNTLCYRTGNPPEMTNELSKYAFEDYMPFGPSALRLLYERILLGDTLPSQMIVNSADSLDKALAIAFFKNPELVLSRYAPDWVNYVDMTHRLSAQGLYSIPPEKATLLRNQLEMLPDPEDAPRPLHLAYLERISEVFVEELELGMIATPVPQHFELISDVDGFALFSNPYSASYDFLYRSGWVGGFWLDGNLIFRKSVLVAPEKWKRISNLTTQRKGLEIERWQSFNGDCILCPPEGQTPNPSLWEIWDKTFK